jgi:hypothetical protein
MRARGWLAALLLLATAAGAAEFGSPGGPPPANLDEMAQFLRQDPYDLELLLSAGTSKGGSAGHLALAIRDGAPGDDLVWSANFYADRDPKHAQDFLTEDLMLAIPKKEYLYGTASSLGPKASFGLDFGEVYKRSVIGIRVYGVPGAQKEALAAFFRRINADFRARAHGTEYHHGEVVYDYLRLNCAKTIGSAFRYGARYEELEVRNPWLFTQVRLFAALGANIPTEMAVKLLEAWNARGYRMDVVLYRKYAGSNWVDPHEEKKIAFKDLPDRFPSVLSRDFRNEMGEYEDYDNLYALYLLYNLGRYGIRVNEGTKRLEVEARKNPMDYPDAALRASRNAAEDAESYGQRLASRPAGHRIGEGAGDPAPRP